MDIVDIAEDDLEAQSRIPDSDRRFSIHAEHMPVSEWWLMSCTKGDDMVTMRFYDGERHAAIDKFLDHLEAGLEPPVV